MIEEIVVDTEAGEHNDRTALEAVEVVNQIVGLYPDDVIASTLNRLGFVTGMGTPGGNIWCVQQAQSVEL